MKILCHKNNNNKKTSHHRSISMACVPWSLSLSLLSLGMVFGALTAVTTPSWAQAVPGSADGARIEQSIDRLTPYEPSVTAPIKKDQKQQIVTTAPDGADQIKLDLKSLVFEGMTVYSRDDISPLFSHLLNKNVSLADIFGVAEALTAKYRNDGYILSKAVIPAQIVNGGVIRLQIIEGYVNKIHIQSPKVKNKELIRQMGEKIRLIRPLQADVMERYTLLLNDISGIKVRSVLSPSKDVTGAADLRLIVEKTALFDGSVQVTNRGSRYLGPLQVNASVQANALFGNHETITAQILTAPDQHPRRELDYFSLGYSRMINAYGTKASATASVNATEPGFTLSEFDVKGVSHSVSFELSHPFIRSRTKNLNGHLRFDMNDTFTQDNVSINPTEDRLRVLRLGVAYQSADYTSGINSASAEINRGLDVFNTRKSGSANLTRQRGDPEFTKITANISRLQRVTNNVSLYAAASGQKSANILLSGEEFGIGGVSFGGAYDGSEITGENGLAGKVELRYNKTAPLPHIRNAQFFTYYDAGRVWDPDNAAVKNRIRSLASVGAGVRFDINDVTSGVIEAALPLTRTVAVENDKDARFFFTLTHRM